MFQWSTNPRKVKETISRRENRSKEIWIFGDLNVDYLKRDCRKTVLLNNFLKSFGLRQLINEITRPNKSGGTCIDYIITNSIYVKRSGVKNDLLADHYMLFCRRKKEREHHDKVKKIGA